MGFLQSHRQKLHGFDIPEGYECVMLKWLKSEGIPVPLPIGEIEENSVLKVDQYFALPKSSIFKVIVKN